MCIFNEGYALKSLIPIKFKIEAIIDFNMGNIWKTVPDR